VPRCVHVHPGRCLMPLVRLADPELVLEVETDSRDRRAAEMRLPAALKVKPGTSMKVILESFPETWAAWVFWHAATRSGVTSVEWVEWERRWLGPDDDEVVGTDLPGPTGPAI